MSAVAADVAIAVIGVATVGCGTWVAYLLVKTGWYPGWALGVFAVAVVCAGVLTDNLR